MPQRNRLIVWCLSLLLMLTGSLSITSFLPRVKAQQERISDRALGQIEALAEEKRNRSPEQRKIQSQLIYELKQQRGEQIAEGVERLETDVEPNPRGRVLVDIRTRQISAELLQLIEAMNGAVEFASPEDNTIRAEFPLQSLEQLAAAPDVNFIQSAVGYANNNRGTIAYQPNGARGLRTLTLNHLPPVAAKLAAENSQFAARADNVQHQLQTSLSSLRASAKTLAQDAPLAGTGQFVSQGDAAHRANSLRDAYGVDGAGLRIGVLSDTVRFLEQSIGSGDLPRDVIVVPGESGITATFQGIGEGTAMMEIIYDLAPGAKLFFATATGSDACFARNIRRLRSEFKCDIIIDDVFYFSEHPFQDGIIARAVNDVTADGALFFSSAGNGGNINDGTGGVWEGDYKDGGTLSTLPFAADYTVHDFGDGVISNRVRASTFGIGLFWSDPLGGATTDYDLFLLDATLSTVKAASLSTQDGTQDPYEFVSPVSVGDRVVIANYQNSAARALHLTTYVGGLALATVGQTKGHAVAVNAYGVSAIPASVARGGAFIGGPTNPVETFTSDGPRRIFFNPNGSAITPDNFLFKTNGGTVRQKPDITAADGVSTSVPGFTTFFGTSAAAPHAGAIAALVKSALPTITNSQLRDLLTSSALDIGPTGYDRTAGHGIVMPLNAVLTAAPAALLEYVSASATAIAADGDTDVFIEPGESGEVVIRLVNNGNAAAMNVMATLSAVTPDVTITAADSTFPDLAPGANARNATPFRFRLGSSVACGTSVQFNLNVKAVGTPVPRNYRFAVQTGQPGTNSNTFSYTGPAVAIPDNNTTGVNVRVPVSGLRVPISSVKLRIDGSDCSRNTGAGIEHGFVGDLVVQLISPKGTVVPLIVNPGNGGTFGRNFCNTLLDDAATIPIQSIRSTGAPPLGPPYTGTFRPASPLSAFAGEDGNGTWTLNVSDRIGGITGNVRAFSILLSTYECEDNRPFLVSGAELSRDAASNELVASVTLRNDGRGATGAVTLNAATIGNSDGRVNTTTTIPATLGNIAPRGAVTFTLRFPGAAYPPGSNVILLYLCSYPGQTFSGGHGLIAP